MIIKKKLFILTIIQALFMPLAPWITSYLLWDSPSLVPYILIEYFFVCGGMMFGVYLFFEGWKQYLTKKVKK
ncbi:hypothetical protein [Vagococcus salmoninarum]|uniref:hypothetical protein n=1 Tax=Vagococcus salmoninarum TaxID=2739 RepID=UPI00187F1AFB|nr:hypothetical protein [Vagococcus salmoninarum]MBE9389161.1 hypothetical protein [Vagococcus salmoninarum]